MIEQRQVRVRLLPMGRYSTVLVLPRWWLRLNGDPDELDLNVSLGVIRIHPPVKTEERNEEDCGGEQ